ncbi:MAG: adenosylcobinamide-GDP ribazoletransferase [Pseudomonadota bacterium]
MSGSLRQDGLADVRDGFGGGRMLEEKLAIIRSSASGPRRSARPLISSYATVRSRNPSTCPSP